AVITEGTGRDVDNDGGGGAPADRSGDYAVITEGTGRDVDNDSGGGAPADRSGDYAVITDAARRGPAPDSDRTDGSPVAVGQRLEETTAAPAPESVPEPRADRHNTPSKASRETFSEVKKIPYDDGIFVAMHLIRKMSDTELDKMLVVLNEHQRKRVTSLDPVGE
ncbi:hypothetical protein ACFZAV_27350, partial [Streptomyces sp. NPDC008343]